MYVGMRTKTLNRQNNLKLLAFRRQKQLAASAATSAQKRRFLRRRNAPYRDADSVYPRRSESELPDARVSRLKWTTWNAPVSDAVREKRLIRWRRRQRIRSLCFACAPLNGRYQRAALWREPLLGGTKSGSSAMDVLSRGGWKMFWGPWGALCGRLIGVILLIWWVLLFCSSGGGRCKWKTSFSEVREAWWNIECLYFQGCKQMFTEVFSNLNVSSLRLYSFNFF